MTCCVCWLMWLCWSCTSLLTTGLILLGLRLKLELGLVVVCSTGKHEKEFEVCEKLLFKKSSVFGSVGVGADDGAVDDGGGGGCVCATLWLGWKWWWWLVVVDVVDVAVGNRDIKFDSAWLFNIEDNVNPPVSPNWGRLSGNKLVIGFDIWAAAAEPKQVVLVEVVKGVLACWANRPGLIACRVWLKVLL